MNDFSLLSPKELDEVIAQASAQKEKIQKDIRVEASKKVLRALDEYDSIVGKGHPLLDNVFVKIEPSRFCIDEEGYLFIE